MLNYFIKKIPKSFLESFIRSKFKVPDLALDPDFTVKIADTKEELEKAYVLLHDCYVSQGLMNKDPSGLRCTLFSLLPETATVIVKYKDEIVGTVTLIKDSRMGLPSDEKYFSQNNKLRASGSHLIEVSSLAVAKNFRSSGHVVSLLLMKYLHHYSLLMGGTKLIITIHPRAESFYSGLLHFKREGDIIQYDYVNGALAVYMHFPLNSNSFLVNLAASFKGTKPNKNMALWLISNMDKRFQFPKLEDGQVLSPVLTPQLMEYFFVTRTNLIRDLGTEKQKIFFEILVHFFGKDEINRFTKLPLNLDLKEYRMSVKIKSSLQISKKFHFADILDLSGGGAYIDSSSDLSININKGDELKLSFKLGQSSYYIDCEVMWVKSFGDLSPPIGFGVRFIQPNPHIQNELRSLHHFQLYSEAA